MIPLSAINQFLFCPRRAALIHVEGIFKDNEHTLHGDIVHEHADLPGYEVAKGVKLLRALPVFSDRLGLSGKCDIVEVHPNPVAAEVTRLTCPKSGMKSEPPHVGSYEKLFPVEFKVGKRRQWENDDAQLCAQALCLEEMFRVSIPRGAVFHADSKRRREIEFTPELRALTEKAIAELHALLRQSEISNLKSQITPLPPAVFKPACEECSLYEICLPRVTSQPESLHRAAERLFET